MSHPLTAIVLAAGHGTRMRSRTPKVLHPLCGRPMIDWILDAVHESKPDRVLIILNPAQQTVAEHVAGRAEAVYQSEPNGTGHALQQVPAATLTSGDVLVINGDGPLLRAETIVALVESHRASGRPATLASAFDPVRRDGRIVRDETGDLARIVEYKDQDAALKSTGGEFNVGLYCFDGQALVAALGDLRPDNAAGELYLTDVFASLRPARIFAIADAGESIAVNDRVELARAAAVMQRRILERHMRSGVTIVDPPSTFIGALVEIGADTVIEPFSIIKGKSRIGSECRIGPHVHIDGALIGDRSDCGPFAKLRPGTELAEDVHIGSFAELVRTRVGRGSAVPHVSYLGDTDLGEDANIGAGSITANYDGTKKNRTEIGDGAFVGVDTMMVAPVKLGRGSKTGAGSVVTKDVPDGATAVGVPARVVRRKTVDSDSS